jgi:hypothetical protein
MEAGMIYIIGNTSIDSNDYRDKFTLFYKIPFIQEISILSGCSLIDAKSLIDRVIREENIIVNQSYAALEEIKNSRMVHDVIWTYNNLGPGGISESTQKEAEEILFQLIDKITEPTELSENQIKGYFNETTRMLERLFIAYPLNEGGIYEYGGLNDFFANIMEDFGFPVKREKYNYISNFVYGGELGDV